MSGDDERDLWSLVLAAGEGTRLRSLTRALHGEDLPKQFAHIESSRTLLQSTVERALGWSRAQHIVVVVASEREALARSQLAAFGDLTIVPQPRNLGTGPGILLPLAQVMARDATADVVILPSDHFVRDEAPFRDTVLHAQARARASRSLVLVGAVPDNPDPQYGWIVPRRGPSGDLYVDSFEEKPNPITAQQLLEAGALWNTFVIVGSAARVWQLCEEHLPEQSRALEACRRAPAQTPEQRALVWRIYEDLPYGDFSRDVLQRALGLEVVPLPECGWSDWGTPERVYASLEGRGELQRLEQRLTERVVPGIEASIEAGVEGLTGPESPRPRWRWRAPD